MKEDLHNENFETDKYSHGNNILPLPSLVSHRQYVRLMMPSVYVHNIYVAMYNYNMLYHSTQELASTIDLVLLPLVHHIMVLLQDVSHKNK